MTVGQGGGGASPLRVLHVATSGGWRGGERQVWFLLQGLAGHGVESVLATPDPGELAGRARALGVPVEPLESGGDLDVVAAVRLRRYARAGFDLLHLHTGRAHALGLLATLGFPVRPRVIVSRRVDFPIKGGLAGKLKYGRSVDRFIAVSHNVKSILERDGVAPARVSVVHSGVDTTATPAPRGSEGVRAELGIPPGAPILLYAGALVPHKAPDILMRSLEYLGPNRHLMVAGVGPLRGQLVQVAAAHHPDRVHWLGQRDDVPRLLAAADAFVLPSREEGLGTAVLDAMLAGTPVVGTRAGGIPEMVEDGVSGLLVPPEDPASLGAALERLVSEPDLARGLAQGALERVQMFSAERMVEGTLGVYQDVLQTRAPGSPPRP